MPTPRQQNPGGRQVVPRAHSDAPAERTITVDITELPQLEVVRRRPFWQVTVSRGQDMPASWIDRWWSRCVSKQTEKYVTTTVAATVAALAAAYGLACWWLS